MRLIHDFKGIQNIRKLFRIVEFILSRTNILNTVNEEKISLLIKNLNLFNQKIDEDSLTEILEKIEFVIINNRLDSFSLEELAILSYSYQMHNQGTQELALIILNRMIIDLNNS
jgi:hypothetical protein